jgi:hypothetical protein
LPSSSVRFAGRALCVVGCCALLAGAGFAIGVYSNHPHTVAGPSTVLPSTAGMPPEAALAVTLQRLSDGLDKSMQASALVLVGDQEFRARAPLLTGKLADNQLVMPKDPNGGPGTSYMAVYNGRPEAAMAAYTWQQTKLREYLRKRHEQNAAAMAAVEALSATAGELAGSLKATKAVPGGLKAHHTASADNWPSTCLRMVQAGLAAKNLPESLRWARELDAALFAMADLHRWLDLLLGNNLASLDFQVRCEGAFTWVDSLPGPKVPYHDDNFPGSSMAFARACNYFEVERQAVRLFGEASTLSELAANGDTSVPAATWVPPHLREAFLLLRSRLEPAMRTIWDKAAHTPFERSYLANMLFRASRAGVLDQMSIVLHRFEHAHPKPDVTDMMDAIFYRAGAWCSGLEWGDRFDPRLMEMAGKLNGDDSKVLGGAHDVTNDFLGDWGNYQGGIWTLHDALDKRKLDCVRGSDMIGGLFRDAGHSGYMGVRLTCGIATHTLSAVETDEPGGRIVMSDSLVPGQNTVAWPAAVFKGLTWPKGYPGPRGPVFAAILCARGLDSYVLAEGYVVRGPHAGELFRAALPHLPGRERSLVQKVFAGPYPAMPTPTTASAYLDGTRSAE